MDETIRTGGCQCGAVRFRVKGQLTDASICHCRMCQKAFGNAFAALVNTRGADFAWTRGRPKTFRSSNWVERGFCADCGTPLSYEAPDGLAIAIGAFDAPEGLPPTVQFGTEGTLSWFAGLHALPGHPTEADAEAAPFVLDIVSYQHPDHDTASWPPGRQDGESGS